jgi:hypothetical protein
MSAHAFILTGPESSVFSPCYGRRIDRDPLDQHTQGVALELQALQGVSRLMPLLLAVVCQTILSPGKRFASRWACMLTAHASFCLRPRCVLKVVLVLSLPRPLFLL